MCGIAGVVDYNKKGFVSQALVGRMCRALYHRGPDDGGVLIKEQGDLPDIGLGHRRLSIIDLSSAGHQPMSNEDGSAWIVFNGEIYNYLELRKLLEQKGHIFKSRTDTEAVIHLYEDYGEDCVKHLRGMFAFAVWDIKNKLLFLARDRFGKKPLLYMFKNGIFAFASEFQSILEAELSAKQVDLKALRYYLAYGYVPAAGSIYKDILKLPPASTLILKNREIFLKRYWQLDYSQKIKISENDAAEETLRLLKEAVQIRLHSDVDLGAFLSGGIDSSSVVAIMSLLSGSRIKTFSIGFNEQGYDELGYARLIAKRYNTQHQELVVKPSALDILPLLVEHYGEPYADSSCIPTYYVCKETSKYVKVALNGDGGDELFGGYDRYQAMIWAESFQRCPRWMRSSVRAAVNLLPASGSKRRIQGRIIRFLEAADLPARNRYARWVGIFSGYSNGNLYSDYLLAQTKNVDIRDMFDPFFDNRAGLPLLDVLLSADVMTYLPYDLLVKVDIVSMANSLEARSPFLDHKLAEFCAKLPAYYKIKGSIKKYILKKAIADIVPSENIKRSKMGFGIPIGEWFRGSLKNFLHETIGSEAFFKRGYFRRECVIDMINDHIDGKKDHTLRLWSLLMLELWHRRFID